MRVVAGTARGRRLQAPDGRAVRPTSDRVREAVFSSLTSMGDVEGARVLDLFAGTGALGIEALSRGATHATFVDDSAAAIACVRANLAAVEMEPSATVVRADADRWLAAGPGPFDLAFADPPYAFEGWAAVLDGLRADTIVLESGQEVTLPEGWRVRKARRYGTTVVTIADRFDVDRLD